MPAHTKYFYSISPKCFTRSLPPTWERKQGHAKVGAGEHTRGLRLLGAESLLLRTLEQLPAQHSQSWTPHVTCNTLSSLTTVSIHPPPRPCPWCPCAGWRRTDWGAGCPPGRPPAPCWHRSRTRPRPSLVLPEDGDGDGNGDVIDFPWARWESSQIYLVLHYCVVSFVSEIIFPWWMAWRNVA